MRKFYIYIFLILISANIFSKDISNREKQYQIISEKNLPVTKINKLLISYKDSLSIPNITKEDIAFYNIIISKLYYFLGAYNKSIDYSKVSLKNYKELKDTSFILYALINIGAIYGEIGENDIALEYFLDFDSLASLSNDSDALSYNYVNIGNIYSDTDPKKTQLYLDKALKFRKKTDKSKNFYFFISTSRANAFFKQKEYQKALKFYLRAFKLANKKYFFYSSLCSNIAATYKELNKTDSSLYYAYMAINYNPDVHDINNLANVYNILLDNYLKLNKTDSVKKYLELYKNYNDSVIINKKLEYVSKLKVLNETDKLVKNNEIQKNKLHQYYTRIKYLIVLSLIILIALVIVIIFYKKTQLSYKKIVKESVQSLKMEEEVKALKQQLPNNQDSNNNLNIEESDKIYNEIIYLLEEKKLFKDDSFTLNKLSEILDVNRTYVSNVINTKTSNSFIKLVNTYRVKESKRLLIDNQNKNLTLDAIGKASGFKSSSSFYRVFKAETGVTPSFYIKNKNI